MIQCMCENSASLIMAWEGHDNYSPRHLPLNQIPTQSFAPTHFVV